jgi:hypothetical protein
MAGTGLPSPAAVDLGLGGDLQQQVKDETEEQRKKRLQAQQAAQMSPGAMSLLGPGMGMTGAGS